MPEVKKFSTLAWTALLKTLLFGFNLIFFALGVAFLAVGIYGLRVFREFFSFAPSTTIYAPIIGIGAFMSVVGLLSLWCTPKGVTWLLYLYGLIVFALFAALLFTSVAFMVRRDVFENQVRDGIQNSIRTYPKDQGAIDTVQTTGRCCGAHNYTDWFSANWSMPLHRVPLSCCRNQKNCTNQNLMPIRINQTDIYTEGCFKKIYDTIEKNYELIGGIGFASAVFVLGGSMLACVLASNLRQNRYEQVQ